MTKAKTNPYADAAQQADRKRVEKLIEELERTARHFKTGEIWDMVTDFRGEIAKKAGIRL